MTITWSITGMNVYIPGGGTALNLKNLKEEGLLKFKVV